MPSKILVIKFLIVSVMWKLHFGSIYRVPILKIIVRCYQILHIIKISDFSQYLWNFFESHWKHPSKHQLSISLVYHQYFVSMNCRIDLIIWFFRCFVWMNCEIAPLISGFVSVLSEWIVELPLWLSGFVSVSSEWIVKLPIWLFECFRYIWEKNALILEH